jgi:deoxyribodipyrimidine photolyase-related protein
MKPETSSRASTSVPEKNRGVLIFPHHLFADHPGIKPGRKVFMVYDPLFFRDHRYPLEVCGNRAFLHLASMKEYSSDLVSRGFTVHQVSFDPSPTFHKDLFRNLISREIHLVYAADPSDHLLEKRLKKASEITGLPLDLLPSPSFLGTSFSSETLPKRGKSLSMTSFYIHQRKEFHILVDDDLKPLGGRWTFDTRNRKPYPRNSSSPPPGIPLLNTDRKGIITNLKAILPSARLPAEPFSYPVTHREARKYLDRFLEDRFEKFGDYEDAISMNNPFLHHSLLSSSLNTGLLTPREVLDRTLEFAGENPIPLNSLEGFIRQILGWREFMKVIYSGMGSSMRTSNFWNHRETIPESFRKGQTGILPVDEVIRKVLSCSYAHHIERLMILGNFLLLTERAPDEIYRWFMENFIDAYDWVMVPNVYGMSQFADGGSMVTKPYICASSYILRMSDLPGGEWCEILDSLFWRFMDLHRDVFQTIPRIKMLLANLDRMGKTRLTKMKKTAEKFLEEFK